MSIIRRKKDHIRLVYKSQTDISTNDSRFYYEPLLASHHVDKTYTFNSKSIGAPIFISSMTGGSGKSKKINRRLALAAKEYKLPMGLGSLRPYIERYEKSSFQIREYCGDDVQLFGNIGISQLENLVIDRKIEKLYKVVDYLTLDGIIIHINPLQEWIQPGGDRLKYPAITTLKTFLESKECTVIVKEVGCGFGPNSLKELINLPLDVIDLAAYGGTNFTKVELLRSKRKREKNPLVNIGHGNMEMLEILNRNQNELHGKEFIFSGGIKSYLDGYYFMKKLKTPSLYGYAYPLLERALHSKLRLFEFIEDEIRGLEFAEQFLTVK